MTKEVTFAEDFRYGTQFFKEGEAVPDKLISELERHQPHALSTFVNCNGTWHKIEDPRIKGWVEQRKTLEKRLRRYFNIKEEKTSKEPENMLKSQSNKIAFKAKPKTK